MTEVKILLANSARWDAPPPGWHHTQRRHRAGMCPMCSVFPVHPPRSPPIAAPNRPDLPGRGRVAVPGGSRVPRHPLPTAAKAKPCRFGRCRMPDIQRAARRRLTATPTNNARKWFFACPM